MRYGSVCSGIEAATAAWHSLGWVPSFFSEIDAFPRAVLAHHYPEVPLHGDFTTIQRGEYADIDVLVGGTPCQSFSVAGLRKGLADPRGNLMLGFGALAQRLRPRWLVWENVPGVLSSNGGRDFGSFLGMLGELGYGFAYRVLDAQYLGVAQRRRRVFVVGHAGDWRRAAAVLFERHSLSGNPAPSRETGQSVANALTERADRGGTNSEGQRLLPLTVGALTDGAHRGGGLTDRTPTPAGYMPSLSLCLNAGAMGRQDAETETLIPTNGGVFDVAHSLRGEGFDASEDGTGRGTPLVPVYAFDALQAAAGNMVPIQFQANMSMPHADFNICQTLGALNQQAVAFDTTQITSTANYSNPQPGQPCHPLAAGAHPPAVAFTQNQRDEVRTLEVAGALAAEPGEKQQTYLAQPVAMRESGQGYWMEDTVAGTLRAEGEDRPSRPSHVIAQPAMQVRRLTPVECERLQGFPDGFTAIPYRGKPADQCPDGPRYKALGNSMAVPVMRWIGERISAVEQISQSQPQAMVGS